MTQLDTTGCFTNSPNAIETFSGRFVDISAMTPEMVDVEDIATALSHACRFGGHVHAEHYSVAEHSCYVADLVHELTQDASAALAALLHDGSEAYLVDVPRPVKPLLKGYGDLEHAVQAVIYQRFDLLIDSELHDTIKLADNRVLKTEARELMSSRGAHWGFGFQEVVPADVTIQCWSASRAKQEFLDRFEQWI